jgi:hypothetical protein
MTIIESRGSAPEDRYQWRKGVYDEIQEVMPLQDSLPARPNPNGREKSHIVGVGSAPSIASSTLQA